MSKIMIVDDETSIRNFCYDVFTKDGHQVITAPNVQAALKMLAGELPDLVILDIQMPGENGLTLLRTLPNQEEHRVPVVMFSGHITSEIEEEARRYGAVDVVEKGMSVVNLTERIYKWLPQVSELPELLSASRTNGTTPSQEKSESDDFKAKVMAVDDEGSIRNLLFQFLEKNGFKASGAESGPAALELFQKEKPDIVLLDMTMPGMDGMIVLEKLKRINPETGVIMVTGVQDEELARQCIKMGAYDYVTKPFDLKRLELVIMTYLTMRG